MTGRQARGERWLFDSFAHELRVTRESVLEYLERYVIEPVGRGVCRQWIAGNASYLGTAIASGPAVDMAVAEALHADLAPMAGISAAADALDRRLIVVRLLGATGPPFHEARVRTARALTGIT